MVPLKAKIEFKLYNVTCKCGHVGGPKWFIRKTFPIRARDGKEASAIARDMPRVKHGKKDAILNCVEIDSETYKIQQSINKNDPYLKCENPQDQKLIGEFSLKIEKEQDFKIDKMYSRKEYIKYKLKAEKERLEEIQRKQLEGVEEYELHLH